MGACVCLLLQKSVQIVIYVVVVRYSMISVSCGSLTVRCRCVYLFVLVGTCVCDTLPVGLLLMGVLRGRVYCRVVITNGQVVAYSQMPILVL